MGQNKAKLTLVKDFCFGETDDRLYGSFIEHLAVPCPEASTSRGTPWRMRKASAPKAFWNVLRFRVG